jgi:hypothetical protein
VRPAMLGGHPPCLQVAYWKPPHLTPKTDKGTVVNLNLWVGTKYS